MSTTRDIEQQLIGKLLMNPALIFEYEDLLGECAFEPVNQKIFDEISTSVSSGKVSTVAIAKTVSGHFAGKQAEAMKYLTSCRALVDLNESTEQQLIYLIEQKQNNTLLKQTVLWHDMAKSGVAVDEIKTHVMDFFNKFEMSDKNETKPFLDHVVHLSEVIDNNRKSDKKNGLRTGLNDYDIFTGGMQLSDLEIIAGKSSMGKTAFVLGRVRHLATMGIPVAVFNYEMSAVQLTARIVSKAVGISSKNMLMYPLSDTELNQYHSNLNKVEGMPIYIADTSGSSLQAGLKQLRFLVKKYGVKYAVFDFIQRMKIYGHKANREQEVGTIAQELKNEAKALNIKIDALSQLNRDKNREGKEPVLGDLRDSGQVEEAADIVTFIHRPEYYLKQDTPDDEIGKAKIIIAKGRNIGVTDFWVGYNAEFTDFHNLDKYEQKLTSIQPNYDF